MAIVFLLDVYYCVIVAWTLFYLIATFTNLPGLPWETCGKSVDALPKRLGSWIGTHNRSCLRFPASVGNWWNTARCSTGANGTALAALGNASMSLEDVADFEALAQITNRSTPVEEFWEYARIKQHSPAGPPRLRLRAPIAQCFDFAAAAAACCS